MSANNKSTIVFVTHNRSCITNPKYVLRMSRKTPLAIAALLLMALGLRAQLTTNELAGQVNTLTSAVPFLSITPDARAGAMGDVGVASSPDVNSMHWNPAKYSFVEENFGVGLSYTPWLHKLVQDIHLSYLTAYHRIDKRQTIAGSLRYFSLGNIVFTDVVGNEKGNYKPNEFALDVAYSMLLSKNLSGAVALRYVHSDLTGGAYTGDTETRAGNAVAADFSVYYRRSLKLGEKNASYALGTNISNIGSRISYSDDSKSNFMPMNLRLGGSFGYEIDDFNSLSVMLDVNKLLIPTPPYYDPANPNNILFGRNSDVPVMQAMVQSFSDAPGGAKEEFNEITYSLGLEYWYAKQFAVRTGYFYENENKGNRKFFTTGVGMKLNVFRLDFSYLVAIDNQHPLKDTLRFSLTLDFASLRAEEKSR